MFIMSHSLTFTHLLVAKGATSCGLGRGRDLPGLEVWDLALTCPV